ncbi:MAG: DUF4294 domain-containing protein [Bergeyella cardium]|uniref:DUF4294 domain-containing protein n=1 Tax=Bergeyella cardium TaxID=1585976 RepID=UPI000EA32CF0|nr:DUF4294 domain-containing protein [Bergeyella cardium]
MNINKYTSIFFLFISIWAYSQDDNTAVTVKSLSQYPQDKIKVDEHGNRYYYDEAQKAKIYEIDGETVVVLDELVLLNKPRFNNQLDKNYYFFINKKLSRVYPLFLEALDQYRDLEHKLEQYKGRERRQYIRNKQNELASQYETKLRELTTSEGQIFAKLMHRATGKTVYEIIKELRGGWSAFWWNVKGNAVDVYIKEPYDPHRFRADEFLENLLQSSWNFGYLKPYEGYQDFKIARGN